MHAFNIKKKDVVKQSKQSISTDNTKALTVSSNVQFK